MTSILKNLIYGLQLLEADIPIMLKKAVETREDDIVSMIADDQLYQRGINGGSGEAIWNYRPYKKITIAIKQHKGQPYDRVTLRDTGAFHESMFVDTDEDGFCVEATSIKTESLLDKYGVGVLRLTDENTSILIEDIQTEIISLIINNISNLISESKL